MIDRDQVEKVVREVVESSQEARETAVPPSERLVALGADHGGFVLKEALKRYLSEELGFRVKDVGTMDETACDYPDFAHRVAVAVASGECYRGIVVDGAGIGSSMAANRVAGVLAACCHDVKTVVNSREHNNANVLTVGSGVVGRGLARQMVRVWLATDFAGGRHERRVRKILDLEKLWTEKS
ncbi:MAG: ribose 5-phosphate isomerase B [Candidatus Eisenbacteria bacterium]|nr:ribose 5-phosphate isomerase B [Candidatus Eisenbacteria bacterium]